MKEVVYLTLEQVFLIHDEQIELFGGDHGLRDLTMLESAVMRPQATFGGKDLYENIFEKAAVLCHSLILNHPFVDGNKRTGMASMIVFLEANGIRVSLSEKSVVEVAVKVATKKWGIEELSSWLRKNLS